MLDLAFIRNHPDIVKEAARVKYNSTDIDYLLEVDRQVLELQRRVEEARAEQNKISERIREAGKDKAQRGALIAEGKLLAGQIKAMEPLLHELEETRQQLLYLVPNIPDPSSPIGKDENDNVPIRHWGEKPAFDFQPLNHYALMQKLDVVDIERAVKVAGARSYALKGDAARLELVLMNFAMDRIARKGFTPLTVPAMAREFGFIGSGQFPKGRDQVFTRVQRKLDVVLDIESGPLTHVLDIMGQVSYQAFLAQFGGNRRFQGDDIAAILSGHEAGTSGCYHL
jgi:seryl-tRNA synthetase